MGINFDPNMAQTLALQLKKLGTIDEKELMESIRNIATGGGETTINKMSNIEELLDKILNGGGIIGPGGTGPHFPGSTGPYNPGIPSDIDLGRK